MTIQRNTLFQTEDGRTVEEFVLTSGNGLTVHVLNLGGVVLRVFAPDADGNAANIVLGFSDPQQYLQPGPYFGAICGRYANRIAHGRFTLDGVEYRLATNNGPHHLHGGLQGFDKAVWNAEPLETPGHSGIRLTHVSPDGDEGFPGTLQVEVDYVVSADNALGIEYRAATDRPTVLNLTNHAYWNLAGAVPGGPDVLGHELQVAADAYVAVDETLIPTGELPPVAGSPLDFRERHSVGERINDTGGGYDHCFVVRGTPGELRETAEVIEPTSRRRMRVQTTEPGVQLYTGNHLDGSEPNGGFTRFSGLCLECQHFPDSPNRPAFPSVTLRPGDLYRQTTVYSFDTV